MKRYTVEARLTEDPNGNACNAADVEAEIAALKEANKSLNERYHDLLYQVECKVPGESRHDTARRQLRQVNNGLSTTGGAQMEVKG